MPAPKHIREGIDAIGLAILHKGLALGTILVGVMIGGFAAHFGRKWNSGIVQGIGAVVFLGSFFVAIFTWRETVERMRQNPGLLLLDALRLTLRGYAMHLSFVPIVGGFFTRFIDPGVKQNPFVADLEDSS